MLRNYLLVALRKLRRNKVITFINVFGLSVSMSVCMLLILIITDQYAYDDFHKDSDRIYRVITDQVRSDDNIWSTASTAFPLGDLLAEQDAVEKKVSIRNSFNGTAKWETSEIPFRGLFTEDSFFEVFSYKLKSGNPASALSLPNSMVLTSELAEKIFNEEEALGQTITIDGYGSFTVTGVMDELPGKTHIDFEALASLEKLPLLFSEGTIKTSLNDWTRIYRNYHYFLLKEGRNVEELNAMFSKASNDNYGPEENVHIFKTQALNDITPGPQLSNSLGTSIPMTFIYVMMAIAMVVLVSACINYSNLTTAHNLGKSREIGVRKVVGARRMSIIYQVMIESLVISFFSFCIAIVILEVIHPLFNQNLASLGAPLSFDLTQGVYGWFILFMIFTGLFAGIVPSMFFSATNPLSALKKQVDLKNISRLFGGGSIPVRKILFVFQFAFSVFFVITMMAIYQQMNLVFETDHGFKTKDMVHVRLEGMDHEVLIPDMEKQAAVSNVSAASHLPAVGSNYNASVMLEGEEDPRYLSYFGVGDNYIDIMGLDLIAGRSFPEEMPKEEAYIILNETALKQYNLGTPQESIGQVLTVDDKPLQIIGVIKDYHFDRLDSEIEAMSLRYLPESIYSLILALEPNADKSSALQQIEAVWSSHTTRPFEYTYFEDEMRYSYGHFELLINMLGYVTILVISIACLGLLGMVIYTIHNKKKEIGIRKVFGAEAKNIISVIGKRFIGLITIAYLIGGPLAYFANNLWLESYAYRIDFGFGAIAIGFLIVFMVALLTVGSQLYKAVRIDPSESLSSE